jgi:hypothetical protein
MKKIISIILVLISLSVKAQTPTPSNYLVQPAKWKFTNPLWMYQGTYISNLTTSTRTNGDTVLTWNPLTYKMEKKVLVSATQINGIKVNTTRLWNSSIWNTAIDGAEAVYLNDTLFQIGGWPTGGFTGNEQYYSLNDGQSWVRAKDGEYAGRHTFVLLKKGLYYYMIGGDPAGTSTSQDEVWRSRDLLIWTKICDAAGWSTPRMFMGGWVKGDTLFAGGGQNQFTGTPTVYRDLYWSLDGITWTLVCSSCLPNIGNLSGTFVMKNDTAYIICGGTYGSSYTPVKTVYRSVNMRTWTLVTSIPTYATGYMYPKAFLINNMVCIYGGARAANSKDLWCSFNGSTWYNFKDTLFASTHAAAIAVKNRNTFVLTSGSDITAVYKFDFNSIINGDTLKRYNTTASQRSAMYSYNGVGASNRIPYYRNGNTLSDTSILTYKDNHFNVGTTTGINYNGIHVNFPATISTDASIPSVTAQNSGTTSGAMAVLRTTIGTGYGGGYPEMWVEASGGTGGKTKLRNVSNHDMEFHTNDAARMYILKTGEVGIGSSPSAGAALFSVNSTTKGFLPPSLNNTQMAAVSSPVAGLQIYNNQAKMMLNYNNGYSLFKSTGVISASFSQSATALTTFTVEFDGTHPNTTYHVQITPTNVLSAALFYVTNKTTTTFDVVYLSALTGTVAFDFLVSR